MQLAIRLTEPVVFLRADHSNPNRSLVSGNDPEQLPPAIVRGLLVLTLDKPIKISSIEVEIEGKCSSEWPEGVGASRVQVYEVHRILYGKATLFNAAEEERERLRRETNVVHRARRHASVGPGLGYDRNAHCSNSENSDEGDSGDESEQSRGRDWMVANSREQALARLEHNVVQKTGRHNSLDPYRQSRYPSIHMATHPMYPADNTEAKTPPYTPIAMAPSLGESERLRLDNETDANTCVIAQSPIGSLASRLQQVHSKLPSSFSRALPPSPRLTPTQSRTYTHAHVSNPGSPLMTSSDPPFRPVGGEVPTPGVSLPFANPSVISGSLNSDVGDFQAHPAHNSQNRSQSGTLSQHDPSHTHSHSPFPNNVPVTEDSLKQRHSYFQRSGSEPQAQDHAHTQPTISSTQSSISVSGSNNQSNSKRRSRARFSLLPGIHLPFTRMTECKESGEYEDGKDRGRDRASRSRTEHERGYDLGGAHRSPAGTPAMYKQGDNAEKTNEKDKGKGKKEKGKSTFEKIGEKLKAGVPSSLNLRSKEGENGSTHNGGEVHIKHWKEFKAGTHTYPLSFSLPSTLPPTAKYPNFSMTYILKADVHRPGVFAPRLKTSKEVFLHSCPKELEVDVGEAGPEDGAGAGPGLGSSIGVESSGAPPAFGSNGGQDGYTPDGVLNGASGGGAINVEREWDNALRYRVEVGKKMVEMGGWLDLRIMLMPLEKIRIWRVAVYLEEKIDYLYNFKKVMARDPPRYHELWSVRAHKVEHVLVHSHGYIKEKEKFVEIPLLPITSGSPDALIKSPLASYILSSSYVPIPHHDFHCSNSRNYLHGSRAPSNSRELLELRSRDGSLLEDAEEDDEEGLDALPTLLGPGPYHLGNRIHIPTCDRIHASYANALDHRHRPPPGTNVGWIKSNAEAKHNIKLIIGVEKVGTDPPAIGENGVAKSKKWEIAVHVGIAVLSCHCVRKWTALPSYSRSPHSLEGLDTNPNMFAGSHFEISCPCDRDRSRLNDHTYTPVNGTAIGSTSGTVPLPVLQSRRASAESSSAPGAGIPNGGTTNALDSRTGVKRGNADPLGAVIEAEAATYQILSSGGQGPPAYDEVV